MNIFLMMFITDGQCKRPSMSQFFAGCCVPEIKQAAHTPGAFKRGPVEDANRTFVQEVPCGQRGSRSFASLCFLALYQSTCKEVTSLALTQVCAMDARSRGRQVCCLRPLLAALVATACMSLAEGEWQSCTAIGGAKGYGGKDETAICCPAECDQCGKSECVAGNGKVVDSQGLDWVNKNCCMDLKDLDSCEKQDNHFPDAFPCKCKTHQACYEGEADGASPPQAEGAGEESTDESTPSGEIAQAQAEYRPGDQNLTGVDAARGIVTWPLKADESPIGVVMAGSLLGNRAVLDQAQGENGTLPQWKAQSKKAAAASVQEAIEEIIDDDPFDSFPGQRAVDEHELRDVVTKAQRLWYPAGDIAGGGHVSDLAHHKANAEAEAVAVMAANEAAVVDTYDMPHPPEAANDAPFARTDRSADIWKKQKLVRSSSPRGLANVFAKSRITSPMMKMLASTHKIKGPEYHKFLQHEVRSGSAGVAEGWRRVLSAPSARLQALFEQAQDVDADVPTGSNAM